MDKDPKRSGDARGKAEAAARVVLAKHPTVIPSPCPKSEEKAVLTEPQPTSDIGARNITRFLGG